MEDADIVLLYFERNEQAISESKSKYGRYCYGIAYSILRDHGDSEESVNDTLLGAWNAIPPERPSILSAFLGRLTRNISVKRLRYKNAEKRGGGEYHLALDELAECVPDPSTVEGELEAKQLSLVIDDFLRTRPITDRRIFIRRYWYLDSISEVCERLGCGESRVKMSLLRSRKKLLERLEREGYK